MNPSDFTAELRDIKPALEIPAPAATSSHLVAALIVLGLLLAATAWWWFARRKRRSASDPVADARRELGAIHELLASGASDQFAVAVSDVLRRYLERHLRAPSVRQTTEEFLATLAEVPGGLLLAQRDVLRDFLRQCDLVKFARGELALPERECLLACAHSFIDATAAADHSDPTPRSTAAAPLAA